MVIESWLEEKYGGGGPGSERFHNDASEIHASKTSDCQRQYWFDHTIGSESDASPYFELGRMFERAYGRALAWKYGDADELEGLPPEDVVDAVPRVRQDVDIEIHLDDLQIVGQTDWVVLEDSINLDKVIVKDGERTAHVGNRVVRYDPEWVQTVVETKTIRDTSWVRLEGKEGHYYQLGCYQHALDTDGQLVYMQRNDMDYIVHDVEYDDALWMDIKLRARRHHHNADKNAAPPATPLTERDCKYCSYRSECLDAGDTPEWL
jgi:CRISPR/Cas system-associated exonuclease Cas4 (RecB family)